jgi:hypothetical protein
MAGVFDRRRRGGYCRGRGGIVPRESDAEHPAAFLDPPAEAFSVFFRTGARSAHLAGE